MHASQLTSWNKTQLRKTHAALNIGMPLDQWIETIETKTTVREGFEIIRGYSVHPTTGNKVDVALFTRPL